MTLWEMMAGQPPFAGLSSLQIATAVTLHSKRPPLDAAWPGRLVKVMVSCWAHDPAQRPDAAGVLKQLLLLRRKLSDDGGE